MLGVDILLFMWHRVAGTDKTYFIGAFDQAVGSDTKSDNKTFKL